MSEQSELWNAVPDGWALDAESRRRRHYDAVLERLARLRRQLLDFGSGAPRPASSWLRRSRPPWASITVLSWFRFGKLPQHPVARVEVGADHQTGVIELAGDQSAVVPPLGQPVRRGAAHTYQCLGRAASVGLDHTSSGARDAPPKTIRPRSGAPELNTLSTFRSTPAAPNR